MWYYNKPLRQLSTRRSCSPPRSSECSLRTHLMLRSYLRRCSIGRGSKSLTFLRAPLSCHQLRGSALNKVFASLGRKSNSCSELMVELNSSEKVVMMDGRIEIRFITYKNKYITFAYTLYHVVMYLSSKVAGLIDINCSPSITSNYTRSLNYVLVSFHSHSRYISTKLTKILVNCMIIMRLRCGK